MENHKTSQLQSWWPFGYRHLWVWARESSEIHMRPKSTFQRSKMCSSVVCLKSKTRMAHSMHWLMFPNGPLPWGPMTHSLTRIWPTGKNLLPPPESRRVICECWTLTLHVYLDSNGYVHGFLPKHQMEKPMMHVLWYLLAQKHKVGSASQTSNESN